MKILKSVKGENYNYRIITTFENHFGISCSIQGDGVLVFRNNSNYYTPIKIIECGKKDAEFKLLKYYYKYL